MSTVVDTDRMVGFPLDSKVTGYGTDGLPVYSNAYNSGDLRVILSDMITNGIVGQDGLEVTLSEAGSSAVVATVGRGTCMVNGVLCTSRTGSLGGITAEYATADVPRKVIGYSIFVSVGDYAAEDVANVRAVRGDTTTSAPVFPEPSRTWFGYDLCIAHVIATSVWDSSANRATFSFDVIDTRMDDELCGFSAPFVDVDTTQFYDQMNQMIANLNSATEEAVELSKNALDDTVAGALTNRITAIEDRFDENGDILPSAIADGSITADMLAASSVTNAKLADNSVTSAKLSQDTRNLLSRFNFHNVSQLQIGVGDSNAWLYVISEDGRKYRATMIASD